MHTAEALLFVVLTTLAAAFPTPFLPFVPCASDESGLTCTVSGGPFRPANGVLDGPAPSATFNGPEAVAFDGNKTLYVADTRNNLIRKLVLEYGAFMVSTVAGMGPTHPGDSDGVGKSAQFGSPRDVMLAPNDRNTLLVVDSAFGLIRGIDLRTNNVSTLYGNGKLYGSADGIGTNARFHRPSAITGSGSVVYVAETYKIRKIDLTTHQVTTVAGNTDHLGKPPTDGVGTAATFSSPRGIALLSPDTLFVSSSRTIRKIHLPTGTVTTVLGNSSTRVDQSIGYVPEPGVGLEANMSPGRLLLLPNDNLVISESAENLVRVADLASGVSVPWVGHGPRRSGFRSGEAPLVTFSSPHGMAYWPDYLPGGAVFIADTNNNAIRVIDNPLNLSIPSVSTVEAFLHDKHAYDQDGTSGPDGHPNNSDGWFTPQRLMILGIAGAGSTVILLGILLFLVRRHGARRLFSSPEGVQLLPPPAVASEDDAYGTFADLEEPLTGTYANVEEEPVNEDEPVVGSYVGPLNDTILLRRQESQDSNFSHLRHEWTDDFEFSTASGRTQSKQDDDIEVSAGSNFTDENSRSPLMQLDHSSPGIALRGSADPSLSLRGSADPSFSLRGSMDRMKLTAARGALRSQGDRGSGRFVSDGKGTPRSVVHDSPPKPIGGASAIPESE